MTTKIPQQRFIGLDIHKEYLVAVGVNKEQEVVFKKQKVYWRYFKKWAENNLRASDEVVLEMTTNAYKVYDYLIDRVASVTVVHPPHVKLIVRAQVMNDRKAALALAQLHAAGMLTGIWIPPLEVRELRTLVAQRDKMRRLSTQAKNRLHSVLHRSQISIPEDVKPFSQEGIEWWQGLPVSETEQCMIQSHLATLLFAEGQLAYLEEQLGKLAADDSRVPLLVQLPGIGLIHAMTLLAAIGDISRFPDAKKLIGYSGLYPRSKESGKSNWRGRITKSGRRDIRRVMVEAAQTAIRHHPHWKAEYARLEASIGKKKAKVAIARKLLIAVWHVLTEGIADRFAVPEKVAASIFSLAYKIGVKHLHEGQTARHYTRAQLDRLGIGRNTSHIPWGTKRHRLPDSRLAD